jgi:hypothetical protein
MEISDAAYGDLIVYGGEDGDVFRHSLLLQQLAAAHRPLSYKDIEGLT